MGFLQRSKSAGVTEQKSKTTIEKVAELNDIHIKGEEKNVASYERSNLASRSPSFSRPRTANAAIGQSVDLQPPPVFKIDFKAGDEIFSFPTPSPRLPPPKSAGGQTVPSPLRGPESPTIGVAIGSPNQSLPPWVGSVVEDYEPNLIPAPLRPTRPAPAIPEHPDLEIPLTAVRRNKTSWKVFGGLFGRKTAKLAPEQPVLRLNIPAAIAEQSVHTIPTRKLQESAEQPTGNTSERLSHERPSQSFTRGQARLEARAEADKASFMPTIHRKPLRSPSVIQKEGLSPMFRSIQAIPEESSWVDDPRKDSPLSMMSTKSFRKEEIVETVAVPGTPTLVLDLPDPRFERYSIMFEKVLEDARPSLLERRQSKMKRNASVKKLELPTISDEEQEIPRLEVNGVPERRATSPGLTKALSIKLGKKMLSPVSEMFSSLNRPRPVRRAKTAPATHAGAAAKSSPSPKTVAPSTSHSSPANAEGGMPPTPLTTTTISDCGSVEVIKNDGAITKQDIEKTEPTWDMMTSHPGDERRSPSTRVMSQVADWEKQIVQVSVAKRISVSSMQSHGSIDNKQNLRPRMVELSKNRTSTFVVIESVEE